jgi:hypothetical protein
MYNLITKEVSMKNINLTVSEETAELKEKTGLTWKTLLRYGIEKWLEEHETEGVKDEC